VKILYLDQTAELGGAELSLFTEVTRLPHEGSVLLFKDGPLREMFAGAGVTVEVVALEADTLGVRKDAGVLAALGAVPGLSRLVAAVAARAADHDVIYANAQKAFVVAALAAALTGLPVVWRLRDVLDAAHFSAALRGLAVGLANRYATRVIANSAATGRAFVLAGGDPARVAVAYPGIAAQKFDEVTTDEVARLRSELGAAEAKLVGVFGRLCAWKGQTVFIDALARLPGVIGVIVGAALFGEDEFAGALRGQAEGLGLGARLHWLGFRDDVPALMQAMDVVVHASTAPEPFGRVVVEGMLAGRPVVASGAGGVEEILRHGETGWLVAPGDAAALAAALRTVLDDPATADKVAAAGRRRARHVFTVEACVAEIDRSLRAAAFAGVQAARA